MIFGENMIEIWGKPRCPYCVKAKFLCQSQRYQFKYKQLDEDFTREELLEQFPDARTFPQIRVHGKPIGGYDELMKWHQNRANASSSRPKNLWPSHESHGG
jgi:glutaredoxin